MQALTKTDPRGTKRHCQNDTCGLPFYDLARSEFTCPNCGAAFNLQLVPQKASGAPPARFTKRMQDRAASPIAPVHAAELPPDAVDDEELAVEVADDVEAPAEADAILETEDEEIADGGSVIPMREGGDEE